MTAYYNEIDPKAAAWLRELIKQGHIVDGVVDERSIVDVSPDELRGFTQCHFFAGIGVWSYALRSAGWADDRPVWTGSCPCQPFSSAGRRGGVDDERHLWPHWHHLISQCQPAIVFGEQVASKDGLGWLDLVSTDMEATGYAFGAADLCAAGVGAPHIRQRLFFGAVRLADADSQRRDGIDALLRQEQGNLVEAARSSEADGLGNADNAGSQGHGQSGDFDAPSDGATAGRHSATAGVDGGLADAADARLQVGRGGSGVEPRSVEQSERLLADGGMADAASPRQLQRGLRDGGELQRSAFSAQSEGGPQAGGTFGPDENVDMAGRPAASPTNGHWRDADWLFCRDGKWRPVEPGTFPLAHGSAQRVGRGGDLGAPINAEKSAEARVMRLRGYGNAIIPSVAASFIGAFIDATNSQM